MENNSLNQIKNLNEPNSTNKTTTFSNVDFCNKDAKLDIKVIGVGGSGCNIINQLQSTITDDNVKLYAFDTDAWSLRKLNNVKNLFIIDKDNLKGYGSNAKIENAKQGVIHDANKIRQELAGTNILFLISCLGKSTGSGAIPEIAKIAKILHIPTISIVSMPSITSEGQEFYNIAYSALEELKKYTTSITTLSNERIVANNPNISFFELYYKANNEFCLIVGKTIKLITNSNRMNIDYSDLLNFFTKNKFFMFNHFVLNSQNLNQSLLTQKFETCINNNISDVNVVGSNQIVAYFNLSRNVSNNILVLFRKSCDDVIKNKNMIIKYGADISPNDECEFTFLIAGNNSLPDLNTEISKLLNEERAAESTKEEKKITIEDHHYDDLITELEVALSPTVELIKTKDIQKSKLGINKEPEQKQDNGKDVSNSGDSFNDIG